MGETDENDLDMSALEDAVAELGLDFEDDEDPREDGPAPLDVDLDAEPGARNLGLDLTELPPPSAGAAPRSMPPLGEATADDLFGPLDDADLQTGSVWDPPSTDESTPSASPLRTAAVSDDDDTAFGDDTTGLTSSEPYERAEADPQMADVVGFTAHGGTITGTIRAKTTKKLFGR